MNAPAPKIHVGVIDHLPPDVQAMIIAMYSRSYQTVMDRIPESDVAAQVHREKLGKYYIEWGHKAVGQLGHTTIFLEGVSQLAAKAIEDSQLFNGQESSTRYIDYSTQPMVIAENHLEYDKKIAEYQEKFRTLYIRALPLVRSELEKQFTFDNCLQQEKDKLASQDKTMSDEDQNKFRTKWDNTIKARTFDICRGLLPSGSVTNVAFTGTFDLINDHFGAMLYHPSKEMRDIAEVVLRTAKQRYDYGIESLSKLRERFSFIERNGATNYFYHHIEDAPLVQMLYSNLQKGSLPYSIRSRRKWDMISRAESENMRFRLGGKLDFGAFRDLHRHRNGVILMPLLTPELGFHPWYLKELPVDIATQAAALLSNLENLIPSIFDMGVHLQYAIPMGARVRVSYDCGFNQLAYLMELRSGKTVHQTLRHWTHDVGGELEREAFFNLGEHIFIDYDKENFSLKRGTQTFNV